MNMNVCRLLPFLLISAISAPVIAQPELKGSPEELKGFLHPSARVMTISAYAEKTAYSDQAIVNLVVTTEAKQLAKSIEANAKLRQSIKETLLKSGIKETSIKNSKFSTSPQYGFFSDQPSSFKVNNRVSVSIESEDALQTLAQIADQYEEVTISGTEFEHSLKEAFKDQVKADAFQKILKQKAFYEESLGLKLVAIGVQDSNVSMAATSGAAELVQAEAAMAPAPKGSYSRADAYEAPRTTTFDEVKYHSNVSVDFKLVE